MEKEIKRGRKKKKIDGGFAKLLSELLQKVKSENGIIQDDVAKAIGVSRQALGKWANGETVPDILDLKKLAKYFNVSADYLLGFTGNQTTDPDLKAFCKYTGLSEKAIKMLSYSNENVSGYDMPHTGNLGLNHFIENINFIDFVKQLHDIYSLYKESETNIFDELYCAGDKLRPMKEVDSEINQALDLISLTGYKVISNSQYFDLCIQKANFALRQSFQDWIDEINDLDCTDCFYE